ncbi:MAG: hypothetical protein BWZ07_02879 [Alphaproteobacteria bacterium ADurb.BinA280]|nr:MAG: hypothetical protein BWZ07_02879 [Alphaproteobacteria bacterium ADurb.BinA280]
MALSRPLAKLERVDDLRTIWSSEPADFTPWLAEEDSLSILSEALGLDLELVAQEQGVGPYRADILCRDLATGTNVLIENQLESTDHPHLGQILTYAAGLDARTIIWIAKRSTEEHRAAVDWLNEVTVDGFSFFLLEIELWKFVGSDNVAPKFNIVSKPNDWRRSVAERARSSELTETQSLYLEYWTALRDYIKRCGGAVTPQKPAPQHWVNCALGRSGINMDVFASREKRWIGVEIVVVQPPGFAPKEAFNALLAQRESIQQETGFPLDWRELPDSKMSRIVTIWNDVNMDDRAEWPIQFDWISRRLDTMRRVFAPRVKSLKPSAA